MQQWSSGQGRNSNHQTLRIHHHCMKYLRRCHLIQMARSAQAAVRSALV
jgi:hypothetical protein